MAPPSKLGWKAEFISVYMETGKGKRLPAMVSGGTTRNLALD